MPFHRFTVGDYEVFLFQAQPHRTIEVADLFPDVDQEEAKSAYENEPQWFAESEQQLHFTQTIPLLRGKGRTILIDTGIPHETENAMLFSGMAKAGITPDDVDLVFLTHRDMDHVGGNFRDGEPALPLARYAIGRTEAETYRVDEVRNHFPTFVGPLEELGILDIVEDDAEIAPGVKLLLSPGHRAGTTSVLVDNQLLLVADTWHTPVQIPNPHWAIKFDTDPALAVESRRELIERAATDQLLVAVPHTPNFGLGSVVGDGTARRWKPTIV